MSYLSDCIPEVDRTVIAGIFETQLRSVFPDKQATWFIENIALRLLLEVQHLLHDQRDSRTKIATAYQAWIDQEVHLALKRINQDPTAMIPPITESVYASVRRDCITALTTRATQLFIDWQGRPYRNRQDDTRNLRASLAPSIPLSDQAFLTATFNKNFKDLFPGKTALWFIQQIERRLAREIGVQDPAKIQEAYEKWRDQEIHLAVARSDQNAGTSLQDDKEAPPYERVRDQILHAIATRMAELLSQWKCNVTPPPEERDQRNLRASLAAYLS